MRIARVAALGVFAALALALFGASAASAPPTEPPRPRAELIFPPNAQHNHASCVVECPNGDLLCCWYRGSGERGADDVRILGSRLRRGAGRWSEPFVLADTSGFPDCNPCMVVDGGRRLWLFWPVILDNHWESALLRFRTSRDFEGDGPPRWEREDVLLVKPGPDFAEVVRRDLPKQWAPTLAATSGADQAKVRAYLDAHLRRAEDKLAQRLGWMPRAHPTRLADGRLLLPLYSDGFDFSLVVWTDDGGKTWHASRPLVGPGNVQPSIVRRRDGTLVAYFRDNGPPPHRVMVSESRDRGATWDLARDTALPDPGAGLEALALRSGRWLLVNNDTEQGRYRLAVHVSEDEGRTWPVVRYLERDEPGPNAGSYSYPSVIQTRDGRIHVTYSYRPNRANAAAASLGSGETIKHVRFDEAWLR